MIDIRMLTGEQVEAYLPLRLRALREHPEAFGMSVEEQEQIPLDTLISRLNDASNPTFGAYVDHRMVGIVSLIRGARSKTRHRATINSMYVAPEFRAQGIGAALMTAVLDFARTCDGLDNVNLGVTVGNDEAQRLYARFGFVSYSIDPRAIRENDRYYDTEWMILRIEQHG